MAELLKRTVLHAAHGQAGGRMVGFGGYDMPVQYAGEGGGVLAEHRWTREHAGLFDVSHMGPSRLRLRVLSGDGQEDHEAVAMIMETLVCGDIRGLKPGQLRYTLLMNDEGGIDDDLMVGRPADPAQQGSLYVVVNAGTKEGDFLTLGKAAGERAILVREDDNALVAIQGPEAEEVVEAVLPGAGALGFMTFRDFELDGQTLTVARSGYTGEDGYEMLIPAGIAPKLWARLLEDARVRPVGLGARDSLRLEAGLPLYGHDIDATTSPIEAGLAFAVNKRRREEGGFPGAFRVLRELKEGPARRRVGLKLASGGAPAREGAAIVRDFTPEAGPEVTENGHHLGVVTSGGPSPTLGHGIAMAYLPADHAELGAAAQVVVRGRAQAAEVVAMPFVPHRYVRKPVVKEPA